MFCWLGQESRGGISVIRHLGSIRMNPAGVVELSKVCRVDGCVLLGSV